MAENLKELLALKNVTESSVDIYIYGDIVSAWYGKWADEDRYPTEIKKAIDDADGRDINVHINSGGGAVFAGMAIYNLLANYEGSVTTYVDGMAASIASVIAMAGDRVIMRTGSALMIHKPLYAIFGALNANDMRKAANELDEIQKAIMQVYEKRAVAGKLAEIEEKVNAETWMTSGEAIKYFEIEEETEMLAVASAESDFIAKFVKNPPQYAQGKAKSDEYIKNKAKRELILIEKGVIK